MAVILLQFSQSYLLKRFWNWWRGQLTPLLPEKARVLLIPRNRFYITFSDEKTIAILHPQSDGQLRELARLPVGGLRLWSEDADLPDNPVFILLLRPGQYLRRRFDLPAAARENLKQVVGFELDRHTPFTADQVYFAVKVADVLPKQSQIRVDVALTPKRVLDGFVNQLPTVSLRQATISAGPDLRPEQDFDLLPPELKSKPPRLLRLLNLGLAGLLVVLLVLAFAVPVVRYDRTIQSLERQVDQTRRAAAKANDIKRELLQLQKQIRFVLDKKNEAPPIITLMEEISQRIPDDTWLTGFQFRDGRINIDGKSPAASKLVELLEASPYLKDVHFVSPITHDRASGLERFRISMEITDGTKPDSGA